MLALEGAAGQTSGARPARLRERAYDVISDSDLRDIGTYFGNDPGDLVTKHRRGRNNIVSGEEQVGVTQPGRSHVDENFVPNRRGDVHILEVEPATECVEYERLHDANVGVESLICPRHLCYQINRGKVSKWSCGICDISSRSARSSTMDARHGAYVSLSLRCPVRFKIWKWKSASNSLNGSRVA